MVIRRATTDDIDAAMRCYDAGRATMRASGNSHQWDDGYPSRALAERDVSQGTLVVACDDDGLVLGCMSFIPGPDPTYASIDGSWLSDGPYHVVHRIAVGVPGKGTGGALMRWAADRAVEMGHGLRCDTHEVNAAMRRTMESLGMTCCGVIHLEDGSPRVAYELLP